MNNNKSYVHIIIEALYAGFLLLLMLQIVKTIAGYNAAVLLSPLCVIGALSPNIIEAIKYHNNNKK